MPRHIARKSRQLQRNRIAGLLMACLAFGAQARWMRTDGIGLRQPSSDVSAALTVPWWSGFGEPALADLQRAVRAHAEAGNKLVGNVSALPPRALPQDTQVTAAFVATRILNVRLMVAGELLASAAQMRNLVAAGAPTPERADAIGKIDAQMAQTRAHAEALRQRRDGLIEAVAAWCGNTPETLPEGLLVALEQARIPSFNAGAEASPGDQSPADPEAIAMNRLALRAHLSEVQQRSEQVAMQVEVLKTREMEVAAAHRRFEVGAGSEGAFLFAYQQWLLDSDRLAVVSGDLAQAWIRLEASTSRPALAASVWGD